MTVKKVDGVYVVRKEHKIIGHFGPLPSGNWGWATKTACSSIAKSFTDCLINIKNSIEEK
jgi:hypothetical protein